MIFLIVKPNLTVNPDSDIRPLKRSVILLSDTYPVNWSDNLFSGSYQLMWSFNLLCGEFHAKLLCDDYPVQNRLSMTLIEFPVKWSA